MLKAVLFDMGGTLEDIHYNEETLKKAICRLDEILKGAGLDPKCSLEELSGRVMEGWDRYGAFRSLEDVECKPDVIWCDYVLKDFDFPREQLSSISETIAHMWEVTYYDRKLRPRVREMLDGLKKLGLKLGIVSNTAALYQVFDILKEYGIRDCFCDVTLSSVVGLRKPRNEIFSVALHQMQIEPAEAVYVGDTVSRDIIGSKRAGFAAAIQIGSFLTREKDAGIKREFEPDYFIEDIYDVLPIVEGLAKE